MINSSTPPDKSPIMPRGGDDGNDKFNKLAQEYQRIKSQNAILKKAVIQEQQKVTNLEKDLREAEQKIRQITEETDILQFNNQRLTKRIAVMQEEMAAKSKEGGWFSSRDNKKSDQLEVLSLELDAKIQENAQLHVEKRDLEEDIKQATQLHSDQVNVLKACVVAKQAEADQALGELQKMEQNLDQLREEMEKQNTYFKESEERLGREVQQIIAEINQSRKKHKVTILNPTATPPSPLSIWRDNKHTRDLIGTFKDLYYAVETHWDTQLDKITLLRNMNPPEQLGLIYKEIAATIPSLSTQMTHISESLHQYLPVLFSKDALPNIEFADTLHRFVNTCKKWLSYQQLRHVELSQQGTGPHPQAHTALADVHLQVLRALDRLVADREVSAIRSLCGVLSVLTESTRALYAQEAAGAGEGGLGKSAEEEGGVNAIVVVNERLLDTQTKTVALLDKFASKLDEYEALAVSGRLLQDGEDSHRLREIASHLIMLNNDITVASKEREFHHLSVQRESESFKHKLKELEDMLQSKDEELKDQEVRSNVTKERVGVLAQELAQVRNEKFDLEKDFTEKYTQLAKEHAEKESKWEKERAEIESKWEKERVEIESKWEQEYIEKQSQLAQEHQGIQKILEQAHEERENQLAREHLEKQNQFIKEREQALESLRAQYEAQRAELVAQKTQLESDHAQILAASVARSQAELDALRKQLDEAQRSVDQLRQELSVQQKRAEDAEQRLRDEQQRLAAQSQDLNAHEGRAQETARAHSTQLQQLTRDVDEKNRHVQELQNKLVQAEGAARAEMAEKAQQVKVLQQKLMTQEQRLEERTRQVQVAERLVAEKEQQLAKLRESPPVASNGAGNAPTITQNIEPQVGSLIDADIISSEPVLTPEAPSLIDDTVPLTPIASPSLTATNAPKYSLTVVDQDGNQTNGLNESAADKEREQALRDFYEGKMQHLTIQAKASDAKALQLFEQYSSLLKALEDKEAERNALLDQIKASSQNILNSKEELESTRTNYDTQLRLLSDHMVELNEKIVQLEGEASAIKGCKILCGKCKAWNSLEWVMGEGRAGQRCIKGNHPLATFML